jgi:hypothetical protein
MNETPTRTGGPPNDGQLRRAEQGVVAGYIHGISERHGHREDDHEPQRRRDDMRT